MSYVWVTPRRVQPGMVDAAILKSHFLDPMRYLHGEHPGQVYIDLDCPVRAPGYVYSGDGGPLYHRGLSALDAGVTIDREGWWFLRTMLWAKGTSGTAGVKVVSEIDGSGGPDPIGGLIGGYPAGAHYFGGAGQNGRSVLTNACFHVFQVGDVIAPAYTWSGGSGAKTVHQAIDAFFYQDYVGPRPINTAELATPVAHWRSMRHTGSAATGSYHVPDLIGTCDIDTDVNLYLDFRTWPKLDFWYVDQEGSSPVTNALKTWLFSSSHWWLFWAKTNTTLASTTPVTVKTAPGAVVLYSFSIDNGTHVTLQYEKSGGTESFTWGGAIGASGQHLIGFDVQPGAGSTAQVSLLVDGILVSTETLAKPSTIHGADDVKLHWHIAGNYQAGVADMVLGTGSLSEAQAFGQYERGAVS